MTVQNALAFSPRPLDLALFDLDDCLYQSEELREQVAENIRRYMHERLGIPLEEVKELCLDLYLNHGTTLAGLVARGHKIDFDDWHVSVHGSLDYRRYLRPDPALRALLLAIPLPRWVFTNADDAHAEECLRLLGVRDCFEGVVTFERVMEAAQAAGLVRHGKPVVCKPNRQAYLLALQLAGGADPRRTLWLDDSTRNIATGHHLGMATVLVGRTGVDAPSDAQIKDIRQLPAALPWLFDASAIPSSADDWRTKRAEAGEANAVEEVAVMAMA